MNQRKLNEINSPSVGARLSFTRNQPYTVAPMIRKTSKTQTKSDIVLAVLDKGDAQEAYPATGHHGT
jgi:hypothetical protein